MSIELLYTSAPQGLKPSSRGFCTVLSTAGMPVNLATRLEGLSAYRNVFPPNAAEAASNPVCYSHLQMSVGGQRLSILSRIAAYGVDYSQRTNKIAHHVVVPAKEQAAAGPAWTMMQPRTMRAQWDGQCITPAAGPELQSGNQVPAICDQWRALTGDAGWAALVAEALAQPVGKPMWIVFSLEQSSRLLGLINEAIALLPERERWQATFSTYVTNLPPDVDCRVRCVLAGTDEARLAPARGSVIDLTQPLSAPKANRFTQVAVQGRLEALASAVNEITAIPPSPPIGTSASKVHAEGAGVLKRDVVEIEYLEDEDSAFEDEGTLQPRMPAPPPVPTIPRLKFPVEETRSRMGSDSRTRRLLFITAIATSSVLAAVIGTYVATRNLNLNESELSNNFIQPSVLMKSVPGNIGVEKPIAAPVASSESLDASERSANDLKAENANANGNLNPSKQNERTAETHKTPSDGGMEQTHTASAHQDSQATEDSTGQVSTSNTPSSPSDTVSPDVSSSTKDTPTELGQTLANAPFTFSLVATIEQDWFDGEEKKVRATGNLDLRDSWVGKKFYSDKDKPGGKRHKVGDLIETANAAVRQLKFLNPNTLRATIKLEGSSLASERDTFVSVKERIAAKVKAWNDIVNSNLLEQHENLLRQGKGGLLLPQTANKLSLSERAAFCHTVVEAVDGVRNQIEVIKEADDVFEQQLKSSFAFVQLTLKGLDELTQLDLELNESIDRIRSLCGAVDEDLGALFEIETEDEQGHKVRRPVMLNLKLSPEMTDKKDN